MGGQIMYTLEREQYVLASLGTTWDFLKNPANLNKITPEDLHFTIVSPLPDIMYNGLIIEYRIAIPLLGTQTWVAEIKNIRNKKSFVDEQRIGPYRFWYHYHELQETGKGTKIIDRVSYAVPFGIAGRILHRIFIRKTLNRIFDYRKSKIGEFLA